MALSVKIRSTEGLRLLSKHFKKGNIRTLISAKRTKASFTEGKIYILKFEQKFKGKYSLEFKQNNGIRTNCKISVILIKLACRPQDNLNLVVCYGFGKVPMMLITNLKSDDKRLSVAMVKVYFTR